MVEDRPLQSSGAASEIEASGAGPGQRGMESVAALPEYVDQAIAEAWPCGLIVVDHRGCLALANQSAVEMLGIPRGQPMGAPLADYLRDLVLENGTPAAVKDLPPDQCLATGQRQAARLLGRRQSDGGTHWMFVNAAPMRDPLTNQPCGVSAALIDVTRYHALLQSRRQREMQEQNVLKIERLGTMAGGIAHDFNNLLTCILGYSALAEAELPVDSAALPMLREMEKAVRRATELTGQMLTYTGKGGGVYRSLDLSLLMAELADVLKAAASNKAVILLELASGMPTMQADAVQIRQLAINLVANASEALLDKGGVIQIRTGKSELTDPTADTAFCTAMAQPGTYVFLEIDDNGCGMSEAILPRIFDPFFTTKFIGRGLGLAAVLGIVRGHEGVIQVASQPNKGTTFRILFPATPPRTVGHEEADAKFPTSQGMETILVVEEEPAVRMLLEQVLQRAGYNVISAESARHALRWLRDPIASIDMALIDLTAPNKGGLESFAEMKKLRPNLRSFVMTSYAEHEARSRFAEWHLAGFIQKPFSARGLVAALASNRM
jgi:two-component system, cell cycle sensor histidine kinase and response regulator CckA